MRLACVAIGLTVARLAGAQDGSSSRIELRGGALVAAQPLHDGNRRYEIGDAVAFGASVRVLTITRAQTGIRLSTDIVYDVSSTLTVGTTSEQTHKQMLVHFGLDAMRVLAHGESLALDAGGGFALRTLQGADFVCTANPCQAEFPPLPLAGRLRAALRLRMQHAAVESAVYTGRDRSAWQSYLLTMLAIGF